MILELTVQFAFAVARCDGHLAKNERDWIESHFTQRYRHDVALSNCAKAFCAHYESAALNVAACLDRINREFTTGHKSALVKLAYDIAAAAGDANQKELKFLQKVCKSWNVPFPAFPQAPKSAQQRGQSAGTSMVAAAASPASPVASAGSQSQLSKAASSGMRVSPPNAGNTS